MYYAEHFIMNTFMLGQATLYGVINLFAVYIFPDLVSAMYLVGVLISSILYSQIFKHMFQFSYPKGFFVGLFIYIIGFMFFIISTAIVAAVFGIAYAIISKAF